MRVLAVSGSLRSGSSSTEALRALALLAGASFDVVVWEGLASLPYFNPDLDVELPPPEVAALRLEVDRAHALVVSTPEYAHGIPGALKNALDWLAGGLELGGKPVALVATSPVSRHARAVLEDVLSATGARVLPAASVSLPLRDRRLDAGAISSDPVLRAPLLKVLIELERAARRVA